MKLVESSSALTSAPVQHLKPGILVVTIHEGKGFSLTKEDEERFLSGNANGFTPGHNRPNSTSLAQGNVNSGNFGGRPKTSGGAINSVPTVHGRYSSKYLPYALVDFDKQQIFVNGVSGSPENPLWAGNSTQYKFDVSRQMDIGISVYIRNPNAPANAGRSTDIWIGSTRIRPSFEQKRPGSSSSKPANGEHGQSGTSSSTIWWQNPRDPLDAQPRGEISVGVDFVENQSRSLKIDDFELLKVVGKGSFGKVMQVMSVYRFGKLDNVTVTNALIGRRIHIESTPSRRSVNHTLSHVQKCLTPSLSVPFWRKSTTLSLSL